MVRHSEESGCLDRTPLVSESHSRLTIEGQTKIQSDLLNELAAEEAETDKSVNPDSDDSQFETCLFNRIPDSEKDIESPKKLCKLFSRRKLPKVFCMQICEILFEEVPSRRLAISQTAL